MSLERYGNFRLTRGDYDLATQPDSGHGKYEGVDFPGPIDPGFVKQLQEDLSKLGILLVGKADGDFGSMTELALREFQIYARFNTTARQIRSTPAYADTLVRANNPSRYLGPVSGVLSEDLANTLVSWLENDCRCPVVVEARVVDRRGRYDISKPPEKEYQNIWRAREVTNPRLAVFAVDLSDRYDGVSPPDFRDSNGRIALGFSKVVKKKNGSLRGGPGWKSLKHSTPSAEILPEQLIGLPWGIAREDQKSTFNVIRVVTDLECYGMFDAVNGYDNAVLSIGPFHHTLLQEKGFGPHAKVYPGELGAYLAYLQTDHAQSYDKLLEKNGIGLGPVIDNKRNWKRDRGIRIYTGLIKLQDSAGQFSIPADNFVLAEYFRSWHWIYRFSSAARTDNGFRGGFWYMTRLRLWEILSAEWDGNYIIQGRNGPARKALIGDVFRSEAAVALLLRYHVSTPAHIVRNGRASVTLRWALNNAGFDFKSKDPKDWTDEEERLLILKLAEGIRIGYEPSPGIRVKKIKGWTIPHVQRILDWPASEQSRYAGRRPTSKLRQSIGEDLKNLSWSRRRGFKFDGHELGQPIWE